MNVIIMTLPVTHGFFFSIPYLVRAVLLNAYNADNFNSAGHGATGANQQSIAPLPFSLVAGSHSQYYSARAAGRADACSRYSLLSLCQPLTLIFSPWHLFVRRGAATRGGGASLMNILRGGAGHAETLHRADADLLQPFSGSFSGYIDDAAVPAVRATPRGTPLIIRRLLITP